MTGGFQSTDAHISVFTLFVFFPGFEVTRTATDVQGETRTLQQTLNKLRNKKHHRFLSLSLSPPSPGGGTKRRGGRQDNNNNKKKQNVELGRGSKKKKTSCHNLQNKIHSPLTSDFNKTTVGNEFLLRSASCPD